MRKMKNILALVMLMVSASMSATTFVVGRFSSFLGSDMATTYRKSVINALGPERCVSIDKMGDIPSDFMQQLNALNQKGHELLVTGVVNDVVTTWKDVNTYVNGQPATKVVYTSVAYLALSFVDTGTGRVVWSTAFTHRSYQKDSQDEAETGAVSLGGSTVFSYLPPSYRESIGTVVSLGDASKKGAKTVFAEVKKGTPYEGRKYTIYEQIPSEEWGFDEGDMLLSKIGALKVTGTNDGITELKVSSGDQKIKEVFDEGVHQMIIK